MPSGLCEAPMDNSCRSKWVLVRARMMQIRLDLFQEQLAFLWDAARSYLEEVGLHNEEKIIRFQLPQIL
jgi:hypothetical protein